MVIRPEFDGYSHWCPGCFCMHYIQVSCTAMGSKNWQFNGDLEKPTFEPSLKHSRPWKADGSICHYNITNGMIVFHEDSTHKLSGHTVPLVDFGAQNEVSSPTP